MTYFGGRQNEKQEGVNVSQPLRYISRSIIPLSSYLNLDLLGCVLTLTGELLRRHDNHTW